MRHVIVLCEGYHDRAFWGAWLRKAGCEDARFYPNRETAVPVRDPNARALPRGAYAYRLGDKAFVRVEPCMGKDKILPRARDIVGDRDNYPFDRLVISCDCDLHADGTESEPAVHPMALHQAITAGGATAEATAGSEGEYGLDGSQGAVVSLVWWQAADPDTSELPKKQTLERLVCAAIREAYPPRATLVESWLRSRGDDAPAASPKAYAWLHLGGWYFDRGSYEEFFATLWHDPQVQGKLQRRLDESDAGPVLRDILA